MDEAESQSAIGARHKEGLTIIESVLGGDSAPIIGLYLYTAVAKMLYGVRHSPRFRKIMPHLIGTPSILLVRPEISQSELAGYLGCGRATAGLQVKACVRHGWVRRTRSSADRRRYVLELTASGREMLKAVAAIVAEHERAHFSALEPRERLQLRALLSKLITGR